MEAEWVQRAAHGHALLDRDAEGQVGVDHGIDARKEERKEERKGDGETIHHGRNRCTATSRVLAKKRMVDGHDTRVDVPSAVDECVGLSVKPVVG